MRITCMSCISDKIRHSLLNLNHSSSICVTGTIALIKLVNHIQCVLVGPRFTGRLFVSLVAWAGGGGVCNLLHQVLAGAECGWKRSVAEECCIVILEDSQDGKRIHIQPARLN